MAKKSSKRKTTVRKSAKKRSNVSSFRGMLATKTAKLSFILLFAVVGVYLLLFSKAATNFEYVGTHPYASQQATAPGKVLTGLQEFNGRLYLGYGDTSANTGPIRVMAYDAGTKTFVYEYTSATEAIWTYRPLNTKLYAPSDDPQGDFSTDFAAGLPWSANTSVRMTHSFDMAQLGNALFLVGSRDVNAIVARSLDGGSTWSTIYSEAPAVGGDIARYYFAAVFNNKLYVQGYNYYNNRPHPSSKVFDGANWATGPNMLPLGGHGWHPKTFGTKLLYQTHLPNNMLGTSGNDKSRLMVFDGATASSPLSSQIYDFAINGSYVYVLGIDGSIQRSTDLATWSNIGQAPANSRSIGFLGATLYAGTTDSKLYRLVSFDDTTPPVSPPPAGDTTLPSISVTSPAANSTVSARVTVTATGSDNVGVTRVEILIDSQLVTTAYSSTASYNWNVRKASAGAHSITAKAYDAAGNVGTSTISVNK
jgi:hypothetical protein